MKYLDKRHEDTTQPVQARPGKSGFQLGDHRTSSVLQRKQADALANKPMPEIVQKKANATGLPDQLKSGIENLSGHAMDDVKVHYNSSQPAQLNAHAYAQGNQVHLAPGQEKHLPHEAWHVVQQKQGRVKPTMQLKGKVNVNDDNGLEKEADVMGVKALQIPNHNDVMQNVNATAKAPLIETAVLNNVIQGKIGPDGDGKLVSAPAFKVYMAKKNKDGSYDMYDQSGMHFKQSGISPDDERYNIYEPGKIDDSEDSEKSSISIEPMDFSDSSSSDESSGSDISLSVRKKKRNIKKRHRIAIKKKSKEHLRLKRIVKQGIFNAIGEGLNPRYIRSDKNKLIQLITGKFSSKENKLGLLPDLFKGINADILEDVIDEIERELSEKMQSDVEKPKKIESIDKYITIQREISASIKEQFQSLTGNIELIHDGNYPPLIIHFPLLRQFIIDNQERQSLKGKKIRAGQAKGMTKLLSARLMSLYNQNRGGSLPRLVEKSSFGFQMATLADLGENLSIRLSPGINKDISVIIAKVLTVIDAELQELVSSETKVEFADKVTDEDQLHEYWGTGKGSKDTSAAALMKSYNQKKTLLKHLVYTQVETGSKGLSMIGRILERNHDNIMFFAAHDATLSKMAQIIFNKSTKAELTENINVNSSGKITGLSSPNLDPSYDKRMVENDEIGDDLQKERLAIFARILKTLTEERDEIDFDDDEVSDSEYEDEVTDGKTTMNIKTGKVVVPSGMAALSVLLTEDNSVSLKAEKTKLSKKYKTEKAKKEKAAGKKTRGKVLTDKDLELIADKIRELESQIAGKDKIDKSAMKTMIPKDSSVYYEDHDVIDMMEDSGIPGYTAADIIMLDINPNITQTSTEKVDFNSELTKLSKSKKKVWVVDLTSATSKEQEQVYSAWKNSKGATLLVTRVSAVKQQEGGQNMNPHGLIHWAHKSSEKDGHKLVYGFFSDLQTRFPRSRISNEIRRFFKNDLKSYSWGRIGIEKGKKASLALSTSGSDEDDYSSEDEKKDSDEKKGGPRAKRKDFKEGKKELKERKKESEEGHKKTRKTALWHYDGNNDVAINPAAIEFFKHAYLEDVATSKAYLTEGEGHTLASQLDISLTILEGEVNPEEFHIIQNSGRGDCLIHTLDTACSIIKHGLSPAIKRKDSARTEELRTVIAKNIDPVALETLISAAVFGNEPGLGPNMNSLVKRARATKESFPPKKVKAKKSTATSKIGGTVAAVIHLPKLGNGTPNTRLFANHVGIHWQLVVKKD